MQSVERISEIITEVFSPFVLSGLLLCLIAMATDPRWVLPVGLSLVFIVGLPFALSVWMHRTGRTSDRYIQERQQRTPFYVGTLVSYVVGAVSLNLVGASAQMLLALNLSIAAILVVALVNLKVKVSVHALVAALFALIAPLYVSWGPLAWVLGGLVWASTVCARWSLRKHSALELALGTALGGLLAWVFVLLR